MIQHLTYPDNFMEEQETTISVIAGLADDPLMKAVIVNQAVPGTTEAFRRIKERRPDIICIAGEAHEDPGVIASAADLVCNRTRARMRHVRPHLLPAPPGHGDHVPPPRNHDRDL